jgi:hypothetical protein
VRRRPCGALPRDANLSAGPGRGNHARRRTRRRRASIAWVRRHPKLRGTQAVDFGPSQWVVLSDNDPTTPSVPFAHRVVHSTFDDRDCVRPREMYLSGANSQDVSAEPLRPQISIVVDLVSIFAMPCPTVDVEAEASLHQKIPMAHSRHVGLDFDSVASKFEPPTNDCFVARSTSWHQSLGDGLKPPRRQDPDSLDVSE